MNIAPAPGERHRPGKVPGVTGSAARLAETAVTARHALQLEVTGVLLPYPAVASAFVHHVRCGLTFAPCRSAHGAERDKTVERQRPFNRRVAHSVDNLFAPPMYALHPVKHRTQCRREPECDVPHDYGQQLKPPTPRPGLRVCVGGNAEGEPRDHQCNAEDRRCAKDSYPGSQPIVRPGERPEIQADCHERNPKAKKRISNPSVNGSGNHLASTRRLTGLSRHACTVSVTKDRTDTTGGCHGRARG